MRMSDWSSVVCSSDLEPCHLKVSLFAMPARAGIHEHILCSSTPAFAGVTLFHSDQSSLAIAPAVSTMRFEKPHSLSYQDTTRTSLPSSTAVSRLSTVDDAGLWLRSIATSGS